MQFYVANISKREKLVEDFQYKNHMPTVETQNFLNVSTFRNIYPNLCCKINRFYLSVFLRMVNKKIQIQFPLKTFSTIPQLEHLLPLLFRLDKTLS